jgi:arsenical pump membrane protein
MMPAAAIAATAVILMLASAFGVQLGLPTCVAGLATLAAVTFILRSSPRRFLREVSWGVIPLVGGLFVLVEALDRSGAIHAVSDYLKVETQRSVMSTAAGSGILVGLVSNLINNLPAGLIAGTAVQAANVPPDVASAVLIGVDLGPNLSVTGSLATILWLTALRRDGVHVMPPALLLALGGLWMTG